MPHCQLENSKDWKKAVVAFFVADEKFIHRKAIQCSLVSVKTSCYSDFWGETQMQVIEATPLSLTDSDIDKMKLKITSFIGSNINKIIVPEFEIPLEQKYYCSWLKTTEKVTNQITCHTRELSWDGLSESYGSLKEDFVQLDRYTLRYSPLYESHDKGSCSFKISGYDTCFISHSYGYDIFFSVVCPHSHLILHVHDITKALICEEHSIMMSDKGIAFSYNYELNDTLRIMANKKIKIGKRSINDVVKQSDLANNNSNSEQDPYLSRISKHNYTDVPKSFPSTLFTEDIIEFFSIINSPNVYKNHSRNKREVGSNKKMLISYSNEFSASTLAELEYRTQISENHNDIIMKECNKQKNEFLKAISSRNYDCRPFSLMLTGTIYNLCKWASTGIIIKGSTPLDQDKIKLDSLHYFPSNNSIILLLDKEKLFVQPLSGLASSNPTLIRASVHIPPLIPSSNGSWYDVSSKQFISNPTSTPKLWELKAKIYHPAIHVFEEYSLSGWDSPLASVQQYRDVNDYLKHEADIDNPWRAIGNFIKNIFGSPLQTLTILIAFIIMVVILMYLCKLGCKRQSYNSIDKVRF